MSHPSPITALHAIDQALVDRLSKLVAIYLTEYAVETDCEAEELITALSDALILEAEDVAITRRILEAYVP